MGFFILFIFVWWDRKRIGCDSVMDLFFLVFVKKRMMILVLWGERGEGRGMIVSVGRIVRFRRRLFRRFWGFILFLF